MVNTALLVMDATDCLSSSRKKFEKNYSKSKLFNSSYNGKKILY